MFWGSLRKFYGVESTAISCKLLELYRNSSKTNQSIRNQHQTFGLVQYKGMVCAIIMQPNEKPVHSGKDSQFTPMKTSEKSAEKKSRRK